MKYALFIGLLALIGCTQQGTAPVTPGEEPQLISDGDDGIFGGCFRVKVGSMQIVDICLNLERHPEKTE